MSIDNTQNKKGINPIRNPTPKNLLNKSFFFIYKYGESGSTSSFYSKGRDASGSGTTVNEGNTIRQVSSERVDILSLGNTYTHTYA